jgi:hypothetical protein
MKVDFDFFYLPSFGWSKRDKSIAKLMHRAKPILIIIKIWVR